MSTPEPFFWGAATSSHQIEGNNIHNDWWAWELAGNVEGKTLSGAATDHWNRFDEDLKLAASLGLNSYRFSVEWSRIEPVQGHWDESALDWYERLVQRCEELKLVPMLTLHHFTHPKWFADRGGFTTPDSPELFLRYTRKVVSRLGKRVPLWCTFNEPVVLALGCYLGRFMPPAEYAPAKASAMLAHILRAHVLSYDCIHELAGAREGRFAHLRLQVGIAHNMLRFLPHRRWHPIDQVAQYFFHRFYNVSFLDAVVGKKQKLGLPPLIPYPEQVSEARGRCTVDFIGVNYYTKAYVQFKPPPGTEGASAEVPIGVTFARADETTSDLQWAIYPEGLGQLLDLVAGYGVPIMITENGIADQDDSRRELYLREHLAQVEAARARGLRIEGYYHWSLLDNFEWIKGYGPRFGLVQVDYETQKRSLRKSASVYADHISRARQVEGNPKF